MPDESSTIIFLGQKKLEAYEVYKDSVSEVLSAQWDAKTLAGVLTKIATKTKQTSVRVLVGDNLAFLSPIFIKTSSDNLKDEVLAKAQEILPESIDDLGVDWKKVGQVGDTYAIQIFAMQKSFLSLLGHAAQSASLEIASIEPVAYVLSRAVPGESEPHLVVWSDESVFAAVCYQGQVLASTLITSMDVYNQILALIDFIKEKYELKVSTGYLAKSSDKISKQELESTTKLDITTEDFDLIYLAANKPDLSGPDENILNITPAEAFPEEDFDVKKDIAKNEDLGEDADSEDTDENELETVAPVKLAAPTLPRQKVSGQESKIEDDSDEKNMTDLDDKSEVSVSGHEFKLNVPPTRSTKKSGIKGMIFLILGLLVLSAMIIGGVFLYMKTTGNKPEIAPETETVANPTPSPSPTPAPEIDKSAQKLQVQNGSGVVGRAGQVSSLLEDAGFKEADTGNADNYDFEKTEISVKAGNQALLDLLIKELESKYAIGTTDTSLDAQSDFDAVIIVGKTLVDDKETEASGSAKTNN